MAGPRGAAVLQGGAFLETLILLLAVFGAVILLTARRPMLLRDLPSSLPIACIALGALPHVPVLSPLLDRPPETPEADRRADGIRGDHGPEGGGTEDRPPPGLA